MKNFSAEKIINSKPLFIAMTAMGLACLYYYLCNAGIYAHDELYGISTVRQGNYFETLVQNYLNTPRGLFIIDVFLQYPQYLSTTEWAYRLFDIAAIAVCLYFGYRLMLALTDEMLARYFVLVFIMCSAFSDCDHNGFICFGWTYKVKLFLVFFLLELIVHHFKTEKRSYWISSVFLYVSASALYEAFVLACIPIAGIVLWELKKSDRLQPKEIARYAASYAIPVICYLILYLYLSSNTSAEHQYTGTAISSNITPDAFFESVWIYSTGAAPFIRTAGGMNAFLSYAISFSPKNLLFLAKDVAFAGLALYYAYRTSTKPSEGFQLGLIFLLTALAICIPYGVSAQYVSWAVSGAVKGYGISYYALYFWAAAFACWTAAILNVFKEKKPRLVAALISLLFAFLAVVSCHTDYNLRTYSGSLDKHDDRYELFDDLVSSEVFACIPGGSTIYCPEYIGIFQRVGTLSEYASAYTGKTYLFENDLSKLEEAPDYYLMLDEHSSLLVFAKCENQYRYSAVTVLSLEPSELDSITLELENGNSYLLELPNCETASSSGEYSVERSSNGKVLTVEAGAIESACISYKSSDIELLSPSRTGKEYE